MNPTNRKALVIGINRYPKLQDGHLKVPADDAEAIAQLLRTYGSFHPVYRFPQGFSVDGEDLQASVHPKDITRTNNLKTQIENLFQPPDDIPHTALLFFAGHGLFDDNGELILATSEAHCRNKEWGIPLNWLCQVLKDSPVKQQIIWLDCCYSGQWINLAKEHLHNSDKQLFFIAATTSYEAAYASSRHGVLTEILLKGLDPSQDSLEGLITHTKLERFIEKNQPTIDQKILVYSYPNNIEFFLTCTRKDTLNSHLYKQQEQVYSQPKTRVQSEKTAKSKSPKSSKSEKPTSSDSNRLYKALLNLDYVEQETHFLQIVSKKKLGAYLIHGKYGYGQLWLLYRLIENTPSRTTASPIFKFSLLSPVRSSSFEDLWLEMCNELKLKCKPTPDNIAKAICTRWKNETVFLIFKDVDQMPEDYLNHFLEFFWQRLAIMAETCQRKHPKTHNFRLLMFLVDRGDRADDWKTISFAQATQALDNWQPQTPIKLPKIELISQLHLLDWLDNKCCKELPSQLTISRAKTAQNILRNTKNGIPEQVMMRICQLCEQEWNEINMTRYV
jgi:hypothetical protein